MKIARHLTIVSSLFLAAGCAHHEQQARYESNPSSTLYGTAATTASPTAGRSEGHNYSSQPAQGTATTDQPLSPTSQRPNDVSRIYSTDQKQPATPPAREALTPNIQGLTQADQALAQQVMKEMRADDSLAALMSKIKIVVNDGKA